MSKAEKLKELAQVYASAWSLIGGQFDTGGMLEEAEVAKTDLHAAIDALFSPDVGTCPVCGSDCNERDELVKAEREIERLTKDAERYRWLIANARSTAEHWGGRWSLVIDGPTPKRDDCEDALDEAIDAAIAAGSQTELKGGV